MKKKYLAITMAMAFFPFVVNAKGDITGYAKSKETGAPMDFATVQLIDAKTGKALTIGTLTDESGHYTLHNVPDGTYLVRISSLGLVSQDRNVTVAGKNVEVPVVHLAEDAKMLQEVVVEGVKGQMRFELDKKVFNVDSNIASAGASASELLESIPSVEVDQDGEVSLRGNSSVTVWLNGKESGLTADNRAQILEQIPAETIERIEVITNPSAKYSPEGTAGIINIVLKKDRRAGYFGAAEIGANTRGGGNASVNINVNSGKWDSYASVGFRMRHNNSGSWSRRDYENGDYLYSDGSNRNHGNNIFVRLGTTFHATDKDDISLSGFGMFGHRWGHGETLYSSNLPGQWSVNNNFSRNRGDMRGVHAELGYTHKFSDTHTLDFTGSFNHWGGPTWNSYLQHQEYSESVDSPAYTEDVYQEQDQHLGMNSWEAKLDYTNQLTKWLKLESGFNGNYSHENSPITTWEGTSQSDMAIAPQLYNRFIYNNNISALYLTLGGKVGNFSFSGGLRGEAWQVRTRSLAYGQSENDVPQFKTNKFALFPSVFLSYSLPYDNEIQINYTRRIRRPWGGELNSFRNISDPTNISYGNPELQPSYTNSFELNYIKSWTYHMISLSAYMRQTSDVMSRISYLDGDVMYSTTANVTDELNSGVEIVVKNSFFRGKFDLTTTGNLYNGHMKAWSMDFENDGKIFPVSGVKQNSFTWDIRCMASVRLPWNLSLQVTGRYNSGHVSAQGEHGASWNVDAGLRKTAGNWSFSLNCRDMFDSRKFHDFIYGDGYTQESKRWRGGRTLRLTVKYSFGNMKAKRGKQQMDSGEPMDGSGYGSEEM